ncbi:DNA repair protein RecO [bacterium]|nr:DNA repair protein RecO [bacterium]
MQTTDGTQYIPAILAGISTTGEADALVRLFSPVVGAVQTRARGLSKPASKLAARLIPAAELRIRLAGHGTVPVLTGVETDQDHPQWRSSLDLLALYWFMAECAYVGSGESEINSDVYRLVANLLRHEAGASRLAAAAVFALKLLRLHGLLPDLDHCALDGHRLGADEPAHLLPNGEGVIGREAYNRHYARTGGGLVRVNADHLERWRRLLSGPLLAYGEQAVDPTDAALLIHHCARAVGDIAAGAIRSAEFLRRQWALPEIGEILNSQP